ncbi:hypothetical protein N8248_06115 [Rhodospirillaceae bacterium]|nr:hypothetical protein [Rhodospirillaceae bacterium]MDC1442258.1 hypothetical protein [Rhodospirillaceae bacterium]
MLPNVWYDGAKHLALSISQRFADNQSSWKILGALIALTGRKVEAFNASQTALELAPHAPEAYSNLGVALQELGGFEDVESNCRQAIALQPDYVQAYYNLDITLKGLASV